jgi:hypothetical protein
MPLGGAAPARISVASAKWAGELLSGKIQTTIAVLQLAKLQTMKSARICRKGQEAFRSTIQSKGLSYNRSSLSLQGAILKNELIISKDEGSQLICWFLGDVGPSQNIEIEYNAQVINSPANQDGFVLEGTKASMN